MAARISVVIVSFNRPREAQGAIQSLLDQTSQPFEIIVIDDASNPQLSLKADFPNFTIVRFDKEAGLSSSRNYGINTAKGDYVAFIDDDVVTSKFWLEEIQKAISEGADILGGPIRSLNKAKPPDWWTEKDFGECAGVGNSYFDDVPTKIWGANMIFRKKVFEEIGLFDSRIGRQKGKLMSSEEFYLLQRAKKQFKFSFVPNAEVFHIVTARRMTLKYVVNWYFYLGRSTRLGEGSKVFGPCRAIVFIVKNMLNPKVMIKKSKRIRQFADFAYNLGLLV